MDQGTEAAGCLAALLALQRGVSPIGPVGRLDARRRWVRDDRLRTLWSAFFSGHGAKFAWSYGCHRGDTVVTMFRFVLVDAENAESLGTVAFMRPDFMPDDVIPQGAGQESACRERDGPGTERSAAGARRRTYGIAATCPVGARPHLVLHAPSSPRFESGLFCVWWLPTNPLLSGLGSGA